MCILKSVDMRLSSAVHGNRQITWSRGKGGKEMKKAGDISYIEKLNKIKEKV